MTWIRQRPSVQKIEEEYLGDIFKDDEEMYMLKERIQNLDDLDRALLIIYADEMSMAKTAKKFGVSPATIHSNIKRIRKILTN